MSEIQTISDIFSGKYKKEELSNLSEGLVKDSTLAYNFHNMYNNLYYGIEYSDFAKALFLCGKLYLIDFYNSNEETGEERKRIKRSLDRLFCVFARESRIKDLYKHVEKRCLIVKNCARRKLSRIHLKRSEPYNENYRRLIDREMVQVFGYEDACDEPYCSESVEADKFVVEITKMF